MRTRINATVPVGFLVIDKSGQRIACGTGSVSWGNLDVTGTGN